MFHFKAGEFTQAQKRKAINNTAELYNAIATDIANAMVKSSYADVFKVKKTITENLKLYFDKYSSYCYFVDEAINFRYDSKSKQRFGRELMEGHQMPFDDVVKAEAALVEAVKNLQKEIDDICEKRHKEFHAKIAEKRKELREAANLDSKMIAYSVLELVGNLATVIGIIGVVLSLMVPPIALAAAAAGITSGVVTLSTGTAALSFAVPAITAAAGVALTRIGASCSMSLDNSIQMDLEKNKKDVLTPGMITQVQQDIAEKMGSSELISLGVIEFAKKHGKEVSTQPSQVGV